METDLKSSAGMPSDLLTNADRGELCVFIAYDQATAYRHALRTLVRGAYERIGTRELRPLPWKFSELVGKCWDRVATGDLERAKIIVVSTSAHPLIPETIKARFATRLGRRWDPTEDGIGPGAGNAFHAAEDLGRHQFVHNVVVHKRLGPSKGTMP